MSRSELQFAFTQAAPAAKQRRAIETLLRLVGEGDSSAFNELYAYTFNKMLRTCQTICPDRGHAEDIVQEAYLAVWINACQYSPDRGSPVSWMASIVRHRAIDWSRKKSSRQWDVLDDSSDIPDSAPNAEQQLLDRDDVRQLDFCMSKLRAGDELTVRDAFYSGLTYAQLALRKGVPEGTMKSSIRRGLMKLRVAMT